MTQLEIGYTPNNLRYFLEKNGMTQKDAYEMLGKSRSAFQRHLHPVDNPNHCTMLHKEWVSFWWCIKKYAKKKQVEF